MYPVDSAIHPSNNWGQTDKSWENWIERKVTSFTHKLKNQFKMLREYGSISMQNF